MKITLSLACLTGIFLLAGCATTPQRDNVEKLFRRADKSGDGRVSRAEYEDFMIVQMFAMHDRNGDGYITEAEFVAEGGKAAQFRRLNVSRTGRLTKAEAMNSRLLRNRLAAPFDEADTNRNGYVTWDEFQVAVAKRRAYTR